MKGVKSESLKNPLEEAQHSQRELEKRLFHLKTLYDVTREIGPLRDIQEIIENLLLMVMGAFGALSGVILLVDINKGRMEAVTQRGMDESFMDKLSEARESDNFLKEMKEGATL